MLNLQEAQDKGMSFLIALADLCFRCSFEAQNLVELWSPDILVVAFSWEVSPAVNVLA
jgi:hypothetical protein